MPYRGGNRGGRRWSRRPLARDLLAPLKPDASAEGFGDEVLAALGLGRYPTGGEADGREYSYGAGYGSGDARPRRLCCRRR